MKKMIDDNSRISDYLFLKNLDIDEKSLKSIYRIITGDPLKMDFDNNKIKEIVAWYEVNSSSTDVISLSAAFYHVFNVIRPFEKDNMRMAQIFMNVVLLKHGCPPIEISLDSRLAYMNMSFNSREESIRFIEDILNKEIKNKKFSRERCNAYNELKKTSEL